MRDWQSQASILKRWWDIMKHKPCLKFLLGYWIHYNPGPISFASSAYPNPCDQVNHSNAHNIADLIADVTYL